MDFSITTADPVTGIVTVGIPTVPKILTGLNKLVQWVTLNFLKDPGRDVITPNAGAGFRAMIGQYNYTFGGNEIQARVILTVKQQQAAIIAQQAAAPGDPNEMLQSLTVENMAFDQNTGDLVVSITVENQAGQTANILI